VLVEEVDPHGVALGRCERHGGVSSAVDRLARFVPCGDGLRVSDLGGGVFRRIRVPTLIDDGGRMRIGRQTLIFRAGRLLDQTNSGGPPPCIELLTVEGEPGPRFPLLGPVTVVGRKAACAEIALVEDSLISARHLRLRLAGQQVLAEDLQSRNGSYVRISGDSTIRPGEVILVGPYRLRGSLPNVPTL
jgi:pSer/pThr/pTyr-binding forkhead associated (FHA) protein